MIATVFNASKSWQPPIAGQAVCLLKSRRFVFYWLYHAALKLLHVTT